MTPLPRPARHAYGGHPDQWADLYLPDGPPRGAVVVIHGGFWRDAYTAELGAPAAADLAAHGFAAWNLEYRRAGTDGRPGAGGWPETFLDVAAGVDALARVGPDAGVDPGRVVLLGHSAGGHLAAWAAARHRLPAGAPGADPAVRPVGVVAQAGVLSLAAAARRNLSGGAAGNLMGMPFTELPGPWWAADPGRLLPFGVPVHAVHGRADADVPFALSADFVAAARAAGDPAELHEVDGDHFAVITPGAAAYARCRELVGLLLP